MENDYVPPGYAERIKQQSQQDTIRVIDHFLAEAVWSLPYGTLVVSVNKDSPNVRLFKVPEQPFTSPLEEIPHISRSAIPDLQKTLTGLLHSSFDPTELTALTIGDEQFLLYGAQISSLIHTLGQARTFRGPFSFYAMSITL